MSLDTDTWPAKGSLDLDTYAMRAIECLICGAQPGAWCDADWPVPAAVIQCGSAGAVHAPRALEAVERGRLSRRELASRFRDGPLPDWL